jgi:triosephosphate isomerase (TIM)
MTQATMRRKLIAGNWKMNGSIAANTVLLDGVRAGASGLAADLAVCVPTPYLAQVQAALAGSAIAWGAQDLSLHAAGAYTGEVSGAMLRDFGCQFVIVGHSERRSLHGETDAIVVGKTLRALSFGLTPIVCVGETLEEREAGQTEQIVSTQLSAVLAAVDAVGKIVVAYEPVWAIGTGKTATPEMAQQVHAQLRALLLKADPAEGAGVRLLYGGSMKPDNARDLLDMADIDGGLIGGAALKAEDFLAIARSV